MQVGKGRPHPLPQTLLGNKKQRHRIPAFTYGILRLAHKRRMGRLYELILYCHHSRSKAFLLFLMLENSWLFCTCIEDRFQGYHLGMAWAWLLGCCTCKFQYCSAVTRYTLQTQWKIQHVKVMSEIPMDSWMRIVLGVSWHIVLGGAAKSHVFDWGSRKFRSHPGLPAKTQVVV